MAARKVVDPDGRTWRVKRRWLHRSVRWRGPLRPRQALDLADGADVFALGDDLPVIGWIFLGVAVLILAAGAIAFVIPALVFLGELLLLLVLLLAGAAARLILRRPWTVEARLDGTNQGREWKVVGWRASGELVDTMAERLRATGRVGDVSWT